ncbi:class D sortase [Ammoniphilus sp. CFH 90114]|uniref:class D sortase n=1 Tax=Ammoniphilus sp. CFH 90114 TaxID=2493665 RepID=UPI001F0C2D17|nr:class D sortase [Ammoniphilus sp. CFH 90114]
MVEHQAFQPQRESVPPKVHRSPNELEVLYPERPSVGEAIGTLTIPKLNQTLPIFHGADEEMLEKGIGHYAHSVLPGEADNAVLSGHRDTVFRQLGKIKKGDQFVVKTLAGTFTYQVRESKIVEAHDKTVIVPTGGPVLTVTTCYPFQYIGDAPQRYILISDLVN